MKYQTGRLANPSKKRKKPASRKKTSVARPRRRRRNPVEPMHAAAPRRTRRRGTSKRRERFTGQVTLRRANPRRRSNPSMMGIDLQQTAMMVVSGGVAAFGGSIAAKFIGERMPGAQKKWVRALTKTGLATVAVVIGVQYAGKDKASQMTALPLALGFSGTLLASAISDMFEQNPMHAGVNALTTVAVDEQPDDAAGYDDDLGDLDDDDDDAGTIDEDDDDAQLEHDLDQIAGGGMQGFFPKAQFERAAMSGRSQSQADVASAFAGLTATKMHGMVQPNLPVAAQPRVNWMQGL